MVPIIYTFQREERDRKVKFTDVFSGFRKKFYYKRCLKKAETDIEAYRYWNHFNQEYLPI